MNSPQADMQDAHDLIAGQQNEKVIKGNGSASDTTSIAWSTPLPLPSVLPEVPDFEFELLPASLRMLVEDSAERLQCPPDYLAAPLIVGLGSLIGRQVSIAPKAEDDWTVVPNLWGAIVGRPGVMKSPALREALMPITELENEAAAVYEAETADHELRAMEYQALKSAKQDQMKQAAKKGESTKRLVEDLVDQKPTEPSACRYIVSDSTVEKLGELLNENPNGLLLVRDELTGFLRSLDRQGHEQDRAFYLEAWNGNAPFTYDRIGRGTVRIEACTVSIIGGIQPGPLSEYLQEAARGGRGDDGLLQRFQLVVWPDPPTTWRNVDRQPDFEARAIYQSVCKRLAKLNDSQCSTMHFDPPAQEIFNNWRQVLEQRLIRGDLPALLEAHLAKYRSLVPSIALILSLAGSNAEAVALEPLAQAIAWAEYLEGHAKRLYASAIRADIDSAHALLRRIQRKDLKNDFTLRDVYRHGWSGLATRSAAKGALGVLQDHQFVHGQLIETNGRPVIQHQINPEAFK